MRRLMGWSLLAALLALSPAWAQPPDTLFTTTTKTATTGADVTDTALWTPTTGNRFALQGCMFSSDGAVDVELEVSDVDVIPPVHLTSYGTVVVGGDQTLLYTSAVDAVLRYTVTHMNATSSGAVSLMCWGYEFI